MTQGAKARGPFWTVDEARRFLESDRSNSDPLFAGYVLMMVLGLRRGELLGLACEDLDLAHGGTDQVAGPEW